MRADGRTVAVTGANGFIGRNLTVRLSELGHRVLPVTRATPAQAAHEMLGQADAIFHLAGVNRPADPAEFFRTNRDYAAWVAKAVEAGGRKPLVVAASSVRAGDGSEYGESKRAGEEALLGLDTVVAVYRLPNIFGKWARPDYNSAVATFCHNIARGLPIRVDDADASLALLYIDDLVDQWLALLDAPPAASGVAEPAGVHHTTVGEVAALIRGFADGREAGAVGEVGAGLERALYATYVAALPVDRFAYPLSPKVDARGSFTELIKTPASGQVSVLTAHPGVTRGGHYHHSKIEKFLVVHGHARFRFRHILTGAAHAVEAWGDAPLVVETIPGWTHDITNVGDGLLVALIWANEVFDPERPDTVAMPL